MPVRRIVLCCEARLEYEDAQVWVRRRKTARDDAASGATYGTSSVTRVSRREEDGAPPAMIISYSSLMVV